MDLYDTLKSNIDTVTNIDWNELINIINNMQRDDHEIIYALIYHHYKTTGQKCNALMSIKGSKGIIVKINNLPLDLQKIIYLYVK